MANKIVVEEYSKLFRKDGYCVDHKGNKFITVTAMTEHWNICSSTFYSRMSDGWSLRDALETQPAGYTAKGSNIVVFGECYDTYNDIDKAYGYSLGTAHTHKSDLEGWLLRARRFYVDDTLYRTITSLSLAYNISEDCLLKRLQRGWSLSDTVHTPVARAKGRPLEPCTDHLGNEYESVTAMTRHYNISESAYRRRRKIGYSLEKALTKPVQEHYSREVCIKDYRGVSIR